MFGQLEPRRGCVNAAVADASRELELALNLLEKSLVLPSVPFHERELLSSTHACPILPKLSLSATTESSYPLFPPPTWSWLGAPCQTFFISNCQTSVMCLTPSALNFMILSFWVLGRPRCRILLRNPCVPHLSALPCPQGNLPAAFFSALLSWK